MAITRTEAEQGAALLALEAINAVKIDPSGGEVSLEDLRLVSDELRKIEHWLRRRALGGDRIAIRQMEEPLGRQVRGPRR